MSRFSLVDVWLVLFSAAGSPAVAADVTLDLGVGDDFVVLDDAETETARANPPALLEVMSRIFFESTALVAEGLGVEIERYEKHHEFALAKRDISTDLEFGTQKGTIRKGHVAGQSFDYRGLVGDEAVIDFRTRWKMGNDLDPDWPFDQPWGYEIIIEGKPAAAAPAGICHNIPTRTFSQNAA